MKQCKDCKEVKPVSDFYSHPKTADGYLPNCKPCHSRRVKENRARNSDRYREYEKARASDPQRVAARLEYQRSERGREAMRASRRRYRENNPIKRAAHIITGNALKSGRLVRQPCEVCGSSEVQAHHDDYGYPLAVRWLCVAHHVEWHKNNEPKLSVGD